VIAAENAQPVPCVWRRQRAAVAYSVNTVTVVHEVHDAIGHSRRDPFEVGGL
jgi:hypothetical protein